MISENLTDWLSGGPAWVVYRVRRDLLGQPEEDPAVRATCSAMFQDPALRALIEELQDSPDIVLNSHKNASHPLHKLVFLADLGLCSDGPGVRSVVERMTVHASPEGLFQVLTNIPVHFGGSGVDQWTWTLCDAPLLMNALVRLGLAEDPRVRSGVDYLASLVRENGWPCVASPTLGSFHGPGHREDPCPYATLVMLRLLGQLPHPQRYSEACRAGAETLLSLWATSRERHPYLFHTGTDFRKLKAPLVWYDLLHVLDVLSNFPWVATDPRFREMVDLLAAKADSDGRYTPESVWPLGRAGNSPRRKSPPAGSLSSLGGSVSRWEPARIRAPISRV